MRTMGVEEEFLLVDPEGRPVAVGAAVVAAAEVHDEPGTVPGGDLETEFKQQMLETGTRPCTGLHDLLDEVRNGRTRAQRAATALDAGIVAIGTYPLAVQSTVTPVERYRRIGREFGLTAWETLTCGCHVHVSVQDDAEGVAVLDRIRPWLPALLALSVNSPFWQGEVSGYQSYRSQVWNRWPTAGPTQLWGSPGTYHHTVEALVASGTILDAGMVYFDARLSARYPTVEVRVADVCLHAEDAALLAALTRALVDTAAAEWRAGSPPSDVRVERLRTAMWRAGRSGLAGDLVSPRTFRPVSAWQVVDELVDHVGPALDAAGDRGRVEALLAGLAARGTGAEVQLRWFGETGDAREVVRRAMETTLGDGAPTVVPAAP